MGCNNYIKMSVLHSSIKQYMVNGRNARAVYSWDMHVIYFIH